MFKEIILTQGKVALVDEKDYLWLNQWKWYYYNDPKGKTGYAKRKEKVNNKWVDIIMHRFILGLNNPKDKTDHIDGDGLNNQRCNLRICTSIQNGYNRSKQIDNTTGYKGVIFRPYFYKTDKNGIRKSYPYKKQWQAQISVNKKHIYIGMFFTAKEAALAYDRKARELHKEFANINFPEEFKQKG